ncbi:MAG: energy transducer TonB [Bacteroidales bacterium]|nr:energy transducer TonB [Bacteroidales bacterium]
MTKKSRKERSFIRMPQYPGGNKAMHAFIAASLVYPPEALQNRIEGEVHVGYTVNNDGHVEDIHVINGLGYGCDQEAIRLISLLKYAAADNYGMKVRSSLRTRVKFRLPVQDSITLSYSVAGAKNKEKPAEKPAGGNSYGYTISF